VILGLVMLETQERRHAMAGPPHTEGEHVPGRPNIVLWNAAADSIPTMPSFSRPLAHPLVWSIAQAAAAEIGYRIL